jgi:molecular chaperone GrpE
MNDMDDKKTTPSPDAPETGSLSPQTSADVAEEGAPGDAVLASELDRLKAEVQALKAENADLKDKWLRAKAETENVLRRAEREKADWTKYAVSDFARDVIQIGDNLRRAIEAVPASAVAADPSLKTLLEGVEVTERELIKVLERQNVVRFSPQGEKFDPHIHEAMMRVETSDQPPETVVKVIQAGYMIADRVLRPAAVIVAKERTSPVPDEGSGAGEAAPVRVDDDATSGGGMAEPHAAQAGERFATSAHAGGSFAPGFADVADHRFDAAGLASELYPGGPTDVRMQRRKYTAPGEANGQSANRPNGAKSANLGTSVLNGKRRSAIVEPVIPASPAANGDIAFTPKLAADED